MGFGLGRMSATGAGSSSIVVGPRAYMKPLSHSENVQLGCRERISHDSFEAVSDIAMMLSYM
jgi:hypothetical protein